MDCISVIKHLQASLHLLVCLDQLSDPVVATALSMPSWLDHATLSNQGYTLDVHQIVYYDMVHVEQKCGGNCEFQLRFKREEEVLVKNESDTYDSITPGSGYDPEQF